MMDASLFILLPTGDEVIGLPLTEEGLRDLVAPLMSVKKYARQNGINLRIFFDEDNVKRFKTDVGGVVDKAAYLSKASVILRNFVSSNSTDVQKNAILEGNYNYIRWDTIECMAHQDVALVVKSAFESPGAPCVLSLSPGIPTDYKQVTIIKDRTYDDGRPELKNIPPVLLSRGVHRVDVGVTRWALFADRQSRLPAHHDEVGKTADISTY